MTDLRRALADLGTCAVSDALDTLGLAGATTGLSPLWPVPATVSGRVRTVQAGERPSDGGGTHIASPLVAGAEPGDVVVIANDGRLDVSCWGGLLGQAAVQNGVAGVVVDGACRDIEDSEALSLPVFGRAVVCVSARGRIVQTAMDEPITVAGVVVRAGDHVVADRNGVVFVAPEYAEQVAHLGARIAAREDAMADAVRDRQPIDEVMHDSRFPSVSADA